VVVAADVAMMAAIVVRNNIRMFVLPKRSPNAVTKTPQKTPDVIV
jgi:hypothetical protein